MKLLFLVAKFCLNYFILNFLASILPIAASECALVLKINDAAFLLFAKTKPSAYQARPLEFGNTLFQVSGFRYCSAILLCLAEAFPAELADYPDLLCYCYSVITFGAISCFGCHLL